MGSINASSRELPRPAPCLVSSVLLQRCSPLPVVHSYAGNPLCFLYVCRVLSGLWFSSDD